MESWLWKKRNTNALEFKGVFGRLGFNFSHSRFSILSVWEPALIMHSSRMHFQFLAFQARTQKEVGPSFSISTSGFLFFPHFSSHSYPVYVILLFHQTTHKPERGSLRSSTPVRRYSVLPGKSFRSSMLSCAKACWGSCVLSKKRVSVGERWEFHG